ncbi:ABC transporter substrate-binding protein [Chloroflexota bacterium]
MKNKIIWTVVSGLMVLSLVMAACGPAEENGEVEEEVEAGAPEYGGTLTVATTSEPDVSNSRGWPVYEQFMGGDWTRGPAGSGITDFASGATALEDSMMPILTESWEMPEPGLWIMKVRQGVHWQDTGTEAGDLMGGREMTVDDVVNSFNWQLHESGNKSWIHIGQPAVAEASTIEKTGPWEITVRTPLDYLTSWTWIVQGAGYHRVYAYDVTKKYNHELIFRGEGWHYSEVVGTGPFYIDEVVDGVSRNFKRNDNYWGIDRLGPGKGNQTPYVDNYVELYIPDRSTSMAAMRTGQVAYTTGLTKEDWERELELSPKLESSSYLQQTTLTRFILMRTDKPDLPFSDIRVRQAMMMATDFNSLKDDYYGGAAEIDVWPLNSNFTGSGYLPLNEMPEAVKELYSYNPEKAKQLLTEAGYPDGFKTKILATSLGNDVDEIAIFKDMWARVGIEMEIDVREQGVFTQIQQSRDYDELVYRMMWTTWPMMYYFSSTRGPSTNNLSAINDPIGSDSIVENAFQAINDSMMVNMPEVYRQMEELRKYLMLQAHAIPRPTPYYYNVWQPWLKNYYGFSGAGTYAQYHWIDQDLKEEMGH